MITYILKAFCSISKASVFSRILCSIISVAISPLSTMLRTFADNCISSINGIDAKVTIILSIIAIVTLFFAKKMLLAVARKWLKNILSTKI